MFDWLISLAGFAFAMSASPGPNNLMLMASGANFGLRRSFMHLAGIEIGFAVMLAAVILGISHLFQIYPFLLPIVNGFGMVYALFLAYKIVSAPFNPNEANNSGSKPLSFLQAAAFQWINAKAWIMCISVSSLYVASGHLSYLLNGSVVILVFAAVGLPCAFTWLYFGESLNKVINTRKRHVLFNFLMGTLIVVVVIGAQIGFYSTSGQSL